MQLFHAEYLRNGIRYGYSGIRIVTYTHHTEQCHFEGP